MTAVIACLVTASVFVALCSIRAGGFWRFAVRTFATLAAACMALSTFARLMDHATTIWASMAVEAVRHSWLALSINRRAALEEMGEKA